MKITIACVGKIKEKYFTAAIDEYSKRLSKYVTLDIAQVADDKAPENMSLAQQEQVILNEGRRLLKVIKPQSYVVALAIDGKQLSSEGLASFITERNVSGVSHITFVIGGSLGLSDEVLSRADYRLSFSKMTFPHQLMRVVLLEQIYRAMRINNNEPYHK
jgi:23S rRNA (pseudouridine1915-N3)-methyltransferase